MRGQSISTLVLLLANGTLIAGTYAFVKVGVESNVSPLGMLAWQVIFASVVVTAVAWLRGQAPRVDWAAMRYAAIAGVLGVSGPSLVTFTALEYMPAGLIGVVGALSPVFTYGIALALGFERLRMIRAAGVALGLIGVLALLLPRGALPDEVTMPCVLAAVAGPLLLASGNVYRSLA